MKPAKRKLTLCEVQEIREAERLREDLRKRASRLSNARLAERYGVHQRTVEKVLAGETWAWVE
jgi:hypothetical protein